jgi:hypothetical protein
LSTPYDENEFFKKRRRCHSSVVDELEKSEHQALDFVLVHALSTNFVRKC